MVGRHANAILEKVPSPIGSRGSEWRLAGNVYRTDVVWLSTMRFERTRQRTECEMQDAGVGSRRGDGLGLYRARSITLKSAVEIPRSDEVMERDSGANVRHAGAHALARKRGEIDLPGCTRDRVVAWLLDRTQLEPAFRRTLPEVEAEAYDMSFRSSVERGQRHECCIRVDP